MNNHFIPGDRNLICLPAHSLEEVTAYLKQVIAGKAFFGRNLALYSSLPEDALQEVILAKIMNIFFEVMNHHSLSELQSFYREFVLYATHQQRETTPICKELFSSAMVVVKTQLDSVQSNKEVENHPAQLMLITDIDGEEGVKSVMGRSVTYAIHANIPIILPLPLLFNILLYTQQPSECWSSPQYFREVQKACMKLSCSDLWSIYKKEGSDYIILHPRKGVSAIQMEDCLSLSWEDVMKRYANYQIEGYQINSNKIQSLIELLKTPIFKQIIWAGHGTFKTTALGLSLEEATQLLHQVDHVHLWQLHSCFILGNIREMVKKFSERSSHILLSNGVIAPSSPPMEDQSLPTYLHLLRASYTGKNVNIQKIFRQSVPWWNGFSLSNHTHYIPPLSTRVLPMTFLDFSKNIDGNADSLIEKEERIYLTTPYHKNTLSLPHSASLLSGVAEPKAHYLLEEVTTPLSFQEFIKSAFDRLQKTPGAEHPRERGSFIHESGEYLFMIKKLVCKDEVYEKVIYYIEANYNNRQIFFEHENHSFAMDPRSYSNTPVLQNRAQDLLQKLLLRTQPSLDVFEEAKLDPQAFYDQIASLYEIPSLNFMPPERASHSPKMIEEREIEGRGGFSRNKDFFYAVLQQDDKTLEEHSNKISQVELEKALSLSISINHLKAFKWLINQNVSFDQESVVIQCLLQARSQMILMLLNFKNFNLSPIFILRLAAEYGNIETMDTLLQHLETKNGDTSYRNDSSQSLLKIAVETKNWEVAKWLKAKEINY